MSAADDTIQIPVPWPPGFERTLGYMGDARFVAWYWEDEFDCLVWDDGCSRAYGGPWYVWGGWQRHVGVGPVFRAYPLSHAAVRDGSRPWWLIVDRQGHAQLNGRDEQLAECAALAVCRPEIGSALLAKHGGAGLLKRLSRGLPRRPGSLSWKLRDQAELELEYELAMEWMDRHFNRAARFALPESTTTASVAASHA